MFRGATSIPPQASQPRVQRQCFQHTYALYSFVQNSETSHIELYSTTFHYQMLTISAGPTKICEHHDDYAELCWAIIAHTRFFCGGLCTCTSATVFEAAHRPHDIMFHVLCKYLNTLECPCCRQILLSRNVIEGEKKWRGGATRCRGSVGEDVVLSGF